MDYTSFNLFSLVSYQIILDMITVLVAEMSFVADVPWSLFFSLCFFLASFTLSLNYSLTPINYIKIHLFIYLIFLIYLTFGWNFALVSLRKTTVVKEYCCVYLSLSLHNLSPWWFRHTSAPSRTGNTWLSLLILPLLLIPKCRHPLWFMWVYLQTQPRLALKFTGVHLSWGLKHIWIWWDFSWVSGIWLVDEILLYKRNTWHDKNTLLNCSFVFVLMCHSHMCPFSELALLAFVKRCFWEMRTK